MATPMPSLLSQITERQARRDKKFFKPIRQQMADEVNDNSLVTQAQAQVNDPLAEARDNARMQREAGRYGLDASAGLTGDVLKQQAGLRRAAGNVGLLNNALMDQYSLNATRRNELLNTMRGLQATSMDSANSLLSAQNRRQMAGEQADAAADASRDAAIGTGIGVVVAIA